MEEKLFMTAFIHEKAFTIISIRTLL